MDGSCGKGAYPHSASLVVDHLVAEPMPAVPAVDVEVHAPGARRVVAIEAEELRAAGPGAAARLVGACIGGVSAKKGRDCRTAHRGALRYGLT